MLSIKELALCIFWFFLVGHKIGCVAHPLEFSLLLVAKSEDCHACFPRLGRETYPVSSLCIGCIDSNHRRHKGCSVSRGGGGVAPPPVAIASNTP